MRTIDVQNAENAIRTAFLLNDIFENTVNDKNSLTSIFFYYAGNNCFLISVSCSGHCNPAPSILGAINKALGKGIAKFIN